MAGLTTERIRSATKASLDRFVGASFFEEVDICHRLTRDSPPLMVDVGAHFGHSLSAFARDGWTVHAFEPDPKNRAALLDLVGDSPRVVVNDNAISSETGKTVEFFSSQVSTGISTLVPFHESHESTTTVTTTRLDSYIEQAGIEDVGFLKIDTEGHDLTVLTTFPWERIAPDVVLCEFEDRKTVPQGHTYRDIAEFLHARGYVVIVSEWHPIVEYGQVHRWKRASLYPVDLADDAWGNLLAVRSDMAGRALDLFEANRRRVAVRRQLDMVLTPVLRRRRS